MQLNGGPTAVEVPYLITITADTADVFNGFQGFHSPNLFSVPAISTIISLTGIGTVSFSDLVYAYVIRGIVRGVPVTEYGLFDQRGHSVIHIAQFPGDNYDLTSAIGPVVGLARVTDSFDEATSGGRLVMRDTLGGITFEATLPTEPATATPLPATAFVIAPALVGLVAIRRRRAG